MADPSSSPLKVTYFSDGKGRNELSRLILAVGNVPYEDDLIGGLEYRELRDTGALPYGQLPTLTVNGEVFGQSCAMARFVARKAGLYPTDPIEALRTDGVVDSWRDTLDLFYETIFARVIIDGKLSMFPHPLSARYGKLAAFVKTELSQQFDRYEGMLAPTGKMCKDASVPFPCWADLAVYDLVKTFEGALTDDAFRNLMKGKSALASLVEKIDELEPIKQHLAKRPYNDVSHYWAKVSAWRRAVESVLMPGLRIVMGIFTRFRRVFYLGNQPAKVD